ncbi:hypothetical protein B0H13DRAFT_1866964 [Mycena leptocephala]|nr:hypothetical protein B0H13DRAFT_1866964 [Mycena leptocephala]
MARVIFALATLVCMLQTLAAPFHPRAETALDCNQASVAAILGIERARTSLGPTNTANDIGSAQNILSAQLSLLTANNGSTNIAFSLFQGKQPSQADAALIVDGLTTAQGTLNKTFSFDNATIDAVKAANTAITTALVTAQQALAVPCKLRCNLNAEIEETIPLLPTKDAGKAVRIHLLSKPGKPVVLLERPSRGEMFGLLRVRN